MKLDTIALIVNPVAGLGRERNLELAVDILQTLRPKHVVTNCEVLGARENVELLQPMELKGGAATRQIAQEACKAGVGAIVAVGGDGTMADVAFGVFIERSSCPIFGVGAGSTNAGHLISCLPSEIHKFSQDGLIEKSVDGLIAYFGDSPFALAFNDFVIGNTVLGTVDKKVCDLDGVDFLEGRRTMGRPSVIGNPTARVVKISDRGTTEIANGLQIGTVIIGFAHRDRFFGQAIVGGVLLTGIANVVAGCLVGETPLVISRLTAEQLSEFEPFRSSYVSVAEDEALELTGFAAPAILAADGNPLKLLRTIDVVRIQPRRNAAMSLRFSSGR